MTPAQIERTAAPIEARTDKADRRARRHIRHNAHSLRVKRSLGVAK